MGVTVRDESSSTNMVNAMRNVLAACVGIKESRTPSGLLSLAIAESWQGPVVPDVVLRYLVK